MKVAVPSRRLGGMNLTEQSRARERHRVVAESRDFVCFQEEATLKRDGFLAALISFLRENILPA